ncbi:MAG: hypothetical protein IPM94_10555 [bacterium]|nr:hypothetical protein [bacterium]
MNQSTQPQGAALQTSSRQIGLRDIVALIIRRKWIILAISLSITAVATVSTLLSAERITASARVMVIGRDPETPTFDRIATNWDLVMSTAAQVASSMPVAEAAAIALYDSVRVIAAADPDFPAVDSVGQLKRVLLRNVSCNQVGESNILNIMFSHVSERFALLAVDAIMKAYIDFNTFSQQNQPAIEYYTEQISNVQTEIESLLNERAGIYNRAGALSLETNANSTIGHIRGVENAMYQARSNREGYESHFQHLLAAIREDPTYVPLTGENGALIFQTTRARLEDAQLKLSEARTKYREDSEWVQRSQSVVDDALATLLHERDNYVRDMEIKVQEHLAREKSYSEALASQLASLATYPDVQKSIESLDMRIRAQYDLLEALQLKRGEVRLKAQTDSRISNLFPLDEPFIAASVAGSKKILYLALSILFAITLSLIVAWFIDSQDHRILDRMQAERSLDVPVLGSISSDQK